MNLRNAAVLFVFVTAGCSDIGDVAQSPNAGPGEDLISPSFAGKYFTEICLTTAPSFEGVPSAIAGQPFVRNQQTGTYYHKNLNVSIKVFDYGCSMVFLSELSIEETLEGLAKGVARNAADRNVAVPRNLDITSNPLPAGGGRYFRIGLPRS